MVATLVRLRLLILRNSLRRSTAQLVLVILGALYGLGLLVALVVGLIALSFAPVGLTRTIVVLGGSAAVLGWIVLPLVLSGIDQTLEPARLAVYPIPLNTLIVGLTICGVLGVPGLVTTIAALATGGSWLRHPGIALAAVVCGAIGALTCVVASRAVTALSAGFSSRRRFREVSGLIVFIPLILAGPIVVGITNGLGDVSDVLPATAEAFSWTPVGAVWAVPSQLALGDGLGAVLRFAIALVFLVALVAVWRLALAHALVNPAQAGSGGRRRVGLGMLGRVPDAAAGAVAARSLIYWFRDPRYLRQLVIVPLLPVLLAFYSGFTETPALILAVGPGVGFLLALATLADVSYDGMAFTLHVATGLTGRADRTGRAAAVLAFALPITVVFTVGSVWYAGAWAMLPALLGLGLGVLLTGVGVTAVTSARLVFPVPAPGDSPFRSKPGANLANSLSAFAVWGVLALLALPEIVLLVVSIVTGSVVAGAVCLVIGVVLGAVLLVVGIRMGGRILDAREPELLAQLAVQR